MLRLLPIAAIPLMLSGCDDPADNCLDERSARIGAYVASQGFIREKLRAPSTADFPAFHEKGVIVVFESECHFKVAGFVDAQNGFGGTVRTRYIIDMEADPEDGGTTP